MREKMFNTNLTRLESKSLHLKLRIESFVSENNQLLEKVHKAESDLSENKRWNNSSEALNWLDTHHSQNKTRLGFVNRRVKPVNKIYVGLQENIICFHCGRTGHYRYTCPLRKSIMQRNLLYVKQIWIRKGDTFTSKKMGRKWIWVPKTNT